MMAQATSTPAPIPPTHRALVLNSTRDPLDISVKTQQTPQARTGSAVIRVLATGVLTYAREVYSGRRPYPYPTPFVPGSAAIGRVAAVGSDATILKPGQLVYFDSFIQARDEHESWILSGIASGFTPSSTALMEGEWRDGTYAEYAKVPLENCFRLNEARLLGSPTDGGLGYSVKNLMYLAPLSVGFGGLRDVDVRAGEKVIIAPAVGSFGGAAVIAALAMGAQVIAVGRNAEVLESIKAFGPKGRIRTVVNTGNVEADTKELMKEGHADVFFDISPVEAANSTHFQSCISALRRGGRVSLMGAQDQVPLPIMTIMRNDITVKGKWMYEKDDIRMMIKLVEGEFLKLGEAGGIQTVGTYSLEEFEAAFDAAANKKRPGLQAVIVP